MKIRVGHLYPDYLNIYADRGNIAVLAARAARRAATSSTLRAIGLGDAAARRGDRPLLHRRRPGPRAGARRPRPRRRRARRSREAAAGGRRRARRLRRLPAARPLLPRPRRAPSCPGSGCCRSHTRRRRAADDRRRAARLRLGRARRSPGFENHAGRTLLDDGRRAARPRRRRLRQRRRLRLRGLPARPRSTAPTCTGRCCRATRGSPTGCSPRRSPTAPARQVELAPLADELEHAAHAVAAARAQARGGRFR